MMICTLQAPFGGVCTWPGGHLWHALAVPDLLRRQAQRARRRHDDLALQAPLGSVCTWPGGHLGTHLPFQISFGGRHSVPGGGMMICGLQAPLGGV